MKKLISVFIMAFAVLILVFWYAERYAERSALPRYCTDTADVIARVEMILTRKEPVGQGAKRPFIIAAKLIFLVPQREGETVEAYLARLRDHLDRTCLGR